MNCYISWKVKSRQLSRCKGRSSEVICNMSLTLTQTSDLRYERGEHSNRQICTMEKRFKCFLVCYLIIVRPTKAMSYLQLSFVITSYKFLRKQERVYLLFLVYIYLKNKLVQVYLNSVSKILPYAVIFP